MVHAARGVMAHVHSTAADPYIACDGAIDKAAKQLRRQKRKLRDHQNASRRSDMELPAEKLSSEDAED
jgi:ribosome-associated translation inhibitor RaiA